MLQNRLCRDQNPDWLVLTPPCCPQASALPGAAHPWHTSWSSADVVTRRVLPFISYVHLVDLKYKAFVWSPKPDFLAIMFFKSADGGSEQNKRQSLGILLFLSALRGSVHHLQCSADSRWSYDVSFDGQYKKTKKNKWNLLNVPWVVLILATSSKPLPRKVSRVQRSRIVSGLLWTLHVGFVLLFVLWVFLCALQPLPNTCASALSVTRKGEPEFGFWISWTGTSWMWF